MPPRTTGTMTNHVRGSSLIQARDGHHRRLHNINNHNKNTHIRSPQEEKQKLQNRQVVVVQTVSVVHVIDETGAVIAYQTIVPEPATQIPDPPAALTAGPPAAADVLPSVVPAADDVLSGGDILPPAASAMPLNPLSLIPSEGSVTSSPSPSPSVFSSLPTAGGYNSSKRTLWNSPLVNG